MNIARGKGQALAQLRCGYGPITLRREGDCAIVEVEYRGMVVEVSRALIDDNFCDTVYPLGIVDAIERAVST